MNDGKRGEEKTKTAIKRVERLQGEQGRVMVLGPERAVTGLSDGGCLNLTEKPDSRNMENQQTPKAGFRSTKKTNLNPKTLPGTERK